MCSSTASASSGRSSSTSYVTGTDYPYDLLAGARGMQLAEAGLESNRTGAKVVLDEITLD